MMSTTLAALVPKTCAEPAKRAESARSLEQALRNCIDLARPYAVQKEELLESFRRAYVELVLAHTNGNRSRAAKMAGMERSHFNKLANRLTGRSLQRASAGPPAFRALPTDAAEVRVGSER
jgi:DNA-binding NtrC family response regulator